MLTSSELINHTIETKLTGGHSDPRLCIMCVIRPEMGDRNAMTPSRLNTANEYIPNQIVILNLS